MSAEELGGRVSKLEQDVSDLKVDTAKIATSLDAMKERQEERHQSGFHVSIPLSKSGRAPVANQPESAI